MKTTDWTTEPTLGYEAFIAKRYLRSGQFFISISTWITILGVTLGVGVVCFVMSMHNGFESEIRNRLLGTTSHISILPINYEYIENYQEVVTQAESVDHVIAASPFIFFKAGISSASAQDGIIVRGINLEQETKTSNLARDLSVGDLSFDPVPYDDDSIPGLLIGSTLAERLGVFLGQPVVLYAMRGEDLYKKIRPRVAKFHVSGIFETGMFEFDAQMLYIDLADAQKLFKTGDAVTGIHCKLDDIFLAEEIQPVLDSLFENRYHIIPWYELHKNLFGWIELEKLFLFLGFILIVLVAAFSIVSTLVMQTMEKRAEIGILKTIGSTPASVAKIFVYNGLTIGIVGILAGFALALTAAWIQNEYQIVSLPPDIYFISYLPVETHLLDFVLVGSTSLVICFLAAIYPALVAARLSVIDVLRH